MAVRAPVDIEPPVADMAPDHAPDAVQDVALLTDQLIMALLPLVTVLGLAVKLTVGAAVVTETVADCVALPPLPVQLSVYVALADKAPVLCDPLTPLTPDQDPAAVQPVALFADQVRVALLPFVTVLGLTEMVTVGTGCVTETVTDCAALLPPLPLQVRL